MREVYTRVKESVWSPETKQPSSLQLGIAVSDVANDINQTFTFPEEFAQLATLTKKFQLGVEIQYEGDMHTLSIPSFDKPLFLGIHQPINGMDNLSDATRDETFQRLKQTMRLAEDVDADYSVFHLQTYDYWDRIDKRGEYISQTNMNLRQLLTEYQEQGYTSPFLVENLEYPKYPSTTYEIEKVLEIGSEYPSVPFGIALDVSHLWRSGFLLRENRHHPNVGITVDNYAKGEIPFDTYLQSTLSMLSDSLRLVHLTGCQGSETHLLPGIVPGTTSVVFDRAYNTDELDIAQTARTLKSAVLSRSAPLFVVSEAHGYMYETMIGNCQDIQTSLLTI